MLRFYETDVSINGTGIMAGSVGISINNSVNPIKTLNNKIPLNQSHNGPITSNVTIDYLSEISNEPNFGIVEDLVNVFNSTNHPKFQLVIGGLSGVGYLSSYNLSVQPNEILSANVSFTVFDEISGELSVKEGNTNYNQTNFSGVGFGSKTFLENTGVSMSNPIYSLDYSFDARWEPIYNINDKKTPSQVQLLGTSESLNFVKDEFINLSYSGLSLTGELSQSFISFVNLASGFANDSPVYKKINFSGFEINSVSMDSDVDGDFARVSISASRYN